MGLPDVANVFSRYFVIGFFVPSFLAAIGLDQIATNGFMPDAFQNARSSAQILVLGGAGLVLGLLLSGLNRPILRSFEGYPLHNAKEGSLRRRLGAAMEGRWRDKYDKLDAVRAQKWKSTARTRAALDLGTQFPADREHILPTRYGNVLRSFETHPRKRYGLDGVVIWPRIEMLLSDAERQTLEDAQGTVAFFTNSCVLVVVLSGLLIVDAGLNTSGGELILRVLLVLGIGALAFSLFYTWAVGAVQHQWGELVRAAFDLHRFEVLEKLGVKVPTTHEEEIRVSQAVTRCLVFGEPIPDEFRGPAPGQQEA